MTVDRTYAKDYFFILLIHGKKDCDIKIKILDNPRNLVLHFYNLRWNT